jgi:hypothetical protein
MKVSNGFARDRRPNELNFSTFLLGLTAFPGYFATGGHKKVGNMLSQF